MPNKKAPLRKQTGQVLLSENKTLYTEKKHGVEVLKGDYSLDELVRLEAVRRGLDPKLIRGMVKTESSENPQAKSSKGARGLMQVMPGTAKDLGFSGNEEDLHDSKVSISLGVSYFKQMLDKYKGDVTKALAAYNAGPGAVDKYKGIPPYEETQNYIEKVKGQSFKEGGKVGVFDREVSPQRIKPVRADAELEEMVARAMSKAMGNYALGGSVPADYGLDPFGKGANSGLPADMGRRQAKAGKRGAGGTPTQRTTTARNMNQFPAQKAGLTQGAGASSGSGGYMGQLSGTAGQLGGFNPLSGPAGNTLQGMIATGNKANVSGAAQAAQSQGSQAYNQLIAPQIDEQMGAMGLGSSSSRTAALAQGAANVGTNVGNTALMADIGAQENAANRQLGAFNPLLQGSGQQLQGLQSAGGLQSGQAGLVSGERMQGQGLAANMQMNQANLQQQANMFNASQPRYARGGRVDESDYLSNLLYGQTFNKSPQFAQPVINQRPQQGSYGRSSTRSGGGDYPSEQPKSRMQAMQEEMLRVQLMQMKAPTPGGRRLDPAAEKWKIANTASGMVPGFDQMRREQALQFIGAGGQGGGKAGFQDSPEALAKAGGDQQQRIAQFYINQGINPLTGAPYTPKGPVYAQGGQVDNGWDYMSMDEFDDGGLVEGRSMPADRVEIHAQGGEGIIPLELMDKLEGYKSKDPMIQEIKELLGMKGNYARGGEVSDFLAQDARRRTGQGGDPAQEAIIDRELEGKLIASLMGPLASLATLPVAGAGAGYEGIKALGQTTGMGKYFPGPFKQTEETSPASFDNIVALLKGFSEKATGQQKKAKGGKVKKDKGYEHGGPIPTNKSKVGKVSPLESLSYANLKSGNPKTPSFSLTGDPNQTPKVSQGVDLGIDIDRQMENTNIERANEDRRRALYEMLMTTSGSAARGKLANLYAMSSERIKASDEKLQGLQVLKAQADQVKAQQDAANAYNQAQLNVSQGRLQNSQDITQLRKDIASGKIMLPDIDEEQ